MKLTQKKKQILAIALLFIVGILFASSTYAAAGEEIAKGISTPALGVVNIVLYIIRGVSLFIMTLAAALLNQFFLLNVGAVPTTIPVVPIGWAALRDLTNGVFLLVILWIALTIILNIENLGGKRLLMRVVLVALFINFSLLMTTMIFGVANLTASIFAKAMPADIGAFIMKSIDAESIGTAITKERLAELKAEEDQKVRETQQQLETATKSGYSPITNTFLAC